MGMSYMIQILLFFHGAAIVSSQSTIGDSRKTVCDCQSDKDDLQFSDMRHSLEKIQRTLERQHRSTSEAHTGSLQSSCPPGFNYSAPIVSKCYAILGERLSWDAAQLRCRQLHPKAHLVVINSALEYQILSTILGNYECYGEASSPDGKRFSYSAVWMAGQRQAIDNCNATFVWKPDNSTYLNMIYTNWQALEPNCAFEKEACAAILLSAANRKLWNDYICSWSMCSVCEIVLTDSEFFS